jgi:GST-like protein
MGYVLFGEPDSGSFMIEAALAEAGQPVECIDLDLKKARPASYLAINPTGKIPALHFPDGLLMTQSSAILLALAEAHPDAGLMPPPGHADRRKALRWLTFIVAEIYPLVEMEDYPLRFVPANTNIDAMRAQITDRLRERWRMVEAESAGQGSFLPSGFSTIDLMIAMVSSWIIGDDWRRGECPRLEAIAATVQARPLSGAVWRRHKGD